MRRLQAFLLFLVTLVALESQELPYLDQIEVIDWKVTNPEPAGTFETPVSSLRFEPRVDLQARNLGEAQADIAIRGGIFETTSFRLGNVSILDPQTGHYIAELPVHPAMLSAPEVLTGLENAAVALNTSVGTISQEWTPVRKQGQLSGGFGTDDLWTLEGFAGWRAEGETGWGAEIGVSASESAGTLNEGDHDFSRYSGRLQYRGEQSQTDLVAGYQGKYFQWPYLYALETLHDLVGSRGIESENLQTQLFLLHHRQEGDSWGWQGSVFFRKNRDDYEFDIDRPGLFNAFEHETEVYGAALSGHWEEKHGFSIRGFGQIQGDSIASTALVFGPFTSRTLVHLALLPKYAWTDAGGRRWELEGGISWDGSNRDSDAVSGMARLGWQQRLANNSLLEGYLHFSEATQVPGYTAIASNPNGGLFRGNPNLGRETARNFEWGMGLSRNGWAVQGALFYREDQDLVDWVFNSAATPFASRFAENVDIENWGLEVFSAFSRGSLESRIGYAFLSKDEDYGLSDADGSFYALNYPEHRVTLSFRWQPWETFTLQIDQEWRSQEENPLRNGRDSGWFGQLGATWKPMADTPLRLALRVNNLWDIAFEEVPGVPGAGRQVSLMAEYGF